MKIIEHYRHAMQVDRSDHMSHLSQAGVDLARSIDTLFDSYDLVLTSVWQRAMETAVAMGHAITFTDARLNTYSEEIRNQQIDGTMTSHDKTTFAKSADDLKTNIHLQNFAKLQLDLYQEIIEKLPENGRTLLVSHGGIIDVPLVALFPIEDHREWGDYPFEYCEGFRIYYDEKEKKFVRHELLRLNKY